VTGGMRECPYCSETHGTMLLCDPARAMLDALVARGRQFDMPTIEFDDVVPDPGSAGGRVLCAQWVVKAGLLPVPGMTVPLLLITGLDAAHRPLPEWAMPGTPAELRRFSELVSNMTEVAIRRAKAAS
jgi:hypothetical protein